MRTMPLKTLLLISILGASNVKAAEFTFIPRNSIGPSTLQLEGEIKDGDAKNLTDWIRNNPAEYLVTNNIQLSSPGGSVSEAIKIAQIVESSGWTALVKQSEVCASACFYIFASAQVRISAGDVIVHRPYLDKTAASSAEHFQQIQGQSAAAIASRAYLTEKGVSSSIIDKMMSLPSTRGYVFTSGDYEDLGFLAPVAEEQAIRRCEIDNSTFLMKYRQNRECIEAIFIPLRNSIIQSLLGKKALEAAGVRAKKLYLNES
ncbi:MULTISPECIES: hypothetical protein [Rhodanobacter]|uniref:COG3904 family protein n=1 Tax=Rhodanobacter TaxID=75309 RepID=UPI000AB4B46D|nr:MULTISPECIES: hypothetical protein [Rhodanobacter]UJJ52004.1 hypothetical protein LRK52_04740 [Rhodanobacter denitrificans]UJJ59213.1 hypothetical protein LRK55_03505 [Rhodanobacter denitrificans]UJM94748.1 hypothetical protein LRK32_04735 [Rhodanobacter denitrificans]UJM98278.1 hypothetical protein LRK44_04740 [Rhodanobacter denitrificans]UJN22309.1 hypothetical protein LRK54_03755 [Rhodanobacter denitrificans]